MKPTRANFKLGTASAERAGELFCQAQQKIYRETDELLVRLMLLEWAVGLIVALLISPESWAGQGKEGAWHLWAALFLGGAVTLFSIWLTRVRPGAAVTRYVIAGAQMSLSSLLICLSGGRMETHFHVFCSLVVLSFYRDWRVLVPATMVVVLEHFALGTYWPFSVYGTATANSWRSLEHCAWVLFEDIFLAIACLRSGQEMQATATRTAALEASERNFRQIFEEAPIGMAVVGLDQRIQDANAALCRMLEYSAEELTQFTPRDIAHRDEVALDGTAAEASLGESGSDRVEKRYLRKDGEVVWSMHSGCTIRDDAGQPRHSLIMMEDITERKRAELGLQEQKARLEASLHANQLIMDNSRDVICTNDAEGRFVTVSGACKALWGYKADELIGKSCTEMVHPDDLARSRLTNDSIMAGNPVTDFENRYIRKDGSVVDVLWSAYWSEKDGTLFQVARDITKRKEAEAALQKTNRQLEAAHCAHQLIMDNSQDVICTLDHRGNFLSTSAACESLWGYRPDELIGRCYLALVHPNDRVRSKEAEDDTRVTAKVTDFVNRCVRKDGSIVDVLWSAHWSEADEILFCIAHDVTERQRIATTLREAKDAADRANRAKSEFLSRMSHELRTPLNAILGFGQLLEMQTLLDPQRPHLRHILTAGQHLLNLINEVLDISRIESDKLQLSLEPVSIAIALQEAVALTEPLAATHKLSLTAPSEKETDYFVLSDRQRLKQVLLNLLSNAVKYTPAGGAVTITCETEGHEAIRLAITDTGIGIAADKMPRVFTPFDRLGAEQSRAEGTGLGLALSKRLVQAMRGEIGVESDVGQGSTFWVRLTRTESPLQSLPSARPEGTEHSGGPSKRTILTSP